jgi:hypothetical protein
MATFSLILIPSPKLIARVVSISKSNGIRTFNDGFTSRKSTTRIVNRRVGCVCPVLASLSMSSPEAKPLGRYPAIQSLRIENLGPNPRILNWASLSSIQRYSYPTLRSNRFDNPYAYVTLNMPTIILVNTYSRKSICYF